ncbi:hypothetical protein MYAM1_000622 [Malassezia yamatoensis]|uniref:D-arabinono-1,4-lactone oxidase n=1 Tax=Malassezia yamatoensis TaxID=253288 RepID=A0AAJ6CG61_9BASI|nr:hypothetical protein MYAM1_000622 [Malassezia yamatoensis]
MVKRQLDQRQRTARGIGQRSAHPPNTFAQSVSDVALQAIVAPIEFAQNAQPAHFRNWAGVYHSDASTHDGAFSHVDRRVFAPNSIEQVVAIIELARRGKQPAALPIPVRAIGRVHSPSDLPFSLGWSIRMDELQGVIEVDSEQNTVTMLGGTYLETISRVLAEHTPKLGMKNLGSISEQTIAGVISTATHGSGIDFPVISAQVISLELVCPLLNGAQIVKCSRIEKPELFNATLCGLGATGIIVSATLSVEPAFRLEQVTEDIPLNNLLGETPVPTSLNPEILARLPYSHFTQNPAALGVLLASGTPLPIAPQYIAPSKSKEPSDIYPFTPCEPAPRQPVDWNQSQDTRQVQQRIEQLVESAQHVRFLIFPQAEMVTIDRARRTDKTADTSSVTQAIYHRLVHFHLSQLFLFASRFHTALPQRVARWIYRWTHDRPPSEPRADPTLANVEGMTLLSNSSAVHVRVDDAPNVFNFDCLFSQYTYEYAIPYEYAAAALRALRAWLDEEHARPDGVRPHFPIEVRFVDADGIYLSHCYGRKTCFIGIIQFRPYGWPTSYRKLFQRFEALMRQFDGRPHWAKTHTSYHAELKERFPHLQDWLDVQADYDPHRMLVNPYVARHLLDEHTANRVSIFKRSRL